MLRLYVGAIQADMRAPSIETLTMPIKAFNSSVTLILNVCNICHIQCCKTSNCYNTISIFFCKVEASVLDSFGGGVGRLNFGSLHVMDSYQDNSYFYREK